MNTAHPRLLNGLSELAPDIDGFVLDLWGVMHDGVQPYPGAIDCLEQIQKAGKRAVFLSNAPRRVQAVIDHLTHLGVPRELYHDVLSSGEAAWRAIRDQSDEFVRSLGRECLHIGPDRDLTMLEGGLINRRTTAEGASFAMITGAHSADSVVADYQSILDDMKKSGLPAICANPDLEVIRGGKREICAGAIAARYEEMGGEVRYYGKPHANVLEEAVGMLGVDKSRAVMVGDSFRTDIAAANAAGVGGVFVARGIYAERLMIEPGKQPKAEAVALMATEFGVTVDHVLPGLIWQADR
tara:strand:+ start:38904 stop:39794 length:891 start_codon:yes stop_codon:yes gene_type:complete